MAPTTAQHPGSVWREVDQWPSDSPINEEKEERTIETKEVKKEEKKAYIAPTNDKAETWGKMQMFRGGGQEVKPNATPTRGGFEPSVVSDVFGEAVARAAMSQKDAQRGQAIDKALERIKASALLASGYVMFDPRLALEAVPMDRVSAAVTSLVMDLAIDDSPAVCDKVPGFMRACLGLLRPQAASIPDIVADSQNILHVMIDVGPRGGSDEGAWISRLWQMLDIFIDSPAIGVNNVVDVLYAFVDSQVFYGPAIEFVLDVILHLVPRHHIQPSGCVPLEPTVVWALKLLKSSTAQYDIGVKAFELLVEIYKLVNKRIEPLLKKVKEPLRTQLFDAFATVQDEKKTMARARRGSMGSSQGTRSRRGSIASSQGSRSRRGSISSAEAIHFIETGVRMESMAPEMKVMGREMFVKGTKKRRGRDESEEEFLASLTHLNLRNKGVAQITGLEDCRKVQVLYLYDNMIPKIENLGWLSKSLHSLYLQNNQIQVMEGLDCLPRLQKLFLDGNKIQKVEGLEQCPLLDELHISNQKLPRGASLSFEPESMAHIAERLSVLNAANNGIQDPMPLCHLQMLRELDLSGNAINDLGSFLSVLNCCQYVQKLTMARNPISKQPKSRETMITMTEYLEELDGKEVTQKERGFLRAMHMRRQASREGSRAGSRRGSMVSQQQQQEGPFGFN